MPFVTAGTENGTDIQLYYEDHGAGRPVVLLQGFPLDGAAWEPQTIALLEAGYRVITVDRRGFGQSSRVAAGFDYDTLAADVDALVTHLDLHDAALVGFSMGTAEVGRYLRKSGSARVSRAVMIAPFGPQLAARESDPAGFPAEVFQGIQDAIRADRHQYLVNYFLTHYCADLHLGSRVSQATLDANFQTAAAAGAYAVLHCPDAWQEEFHDDLRAIDIPLLAIQGTADRNIPIDYGARRIPEFVPGAKVLEIPNGPHGVAWTHREIVNPALLEFLAAGA